MKKQKHLEAKLTFKLTNQELNKLQEQANQETNGNVSKYLRQVLGAL